MKNKKGIFFTLIAITLISILAISTTIITISNQRESINKRITTLNNYINEIEQDLPRKLYIAGYRTIFLYEKRIIENGTYISNAETLFQEAFFNGTIEGTISADEQALLTGVIYDDIIQEINTETQRFNLNTTIQNPSATFTQEDPWHIKIELTIDMNIIELGGLAEWNKTTTIKTYIPIKNFEDPIYLINTNGIIAHKIIPTPFETMVTGTNVTNLTEHLNNKYYKATNEAPSFINRLEGNFTGNDQGIESLVYLPELIANGFGVQDKTIVDHLYFSNSNPATKTVTGMPSWFKIDQPHENTYDVSGIVV